MNKKISVLTSVYNDEENIGNAIESILNQEYENFEFLIMDDCSTDETRNICNKYSKKDKRIKIFRNSKNLGLTKSLNILIKNSSGFFVARQDSDDISYDKRLATQYKLLSETNIDGCTTLALIKDTNKVIPKFSRYVSPKLVIKYKNPFIHGTLMLKREVMNEIGFYNENFYYAQDYKLMKDLIDKKYNLKIISKVLYQLNMNNNISKIHKKEQREYAQYVKKGKTPTL